MFGQRLLFLAAAWLASAGPHTAMAQGRAIPDSTQKSDSAVIAAGHTYAKQICASCHDISSRVDDAAARARPPSFFAIANAPTTTAMGLNAFFVTPHAPMPNLIIAPEDRQSVIAYIMSLRRQKPPST